METRPLKILAIDDKEDNLTVLRALVGDSIPGARVLTALDGRRGLELAVAEDPDVILLDIVMPGMDGFEVCRRLKGDERLRHIPVVFLTALKTQQESRIKALEVGAEAFLSKPIDETELTAQISAMAKIRASNDRERQQKERLAALVEERTRDLVQELTERRRAELALRESEGKLRAIFEHMPAGCSVAEVVYEDGRPVDYRILEVNPAYEAITGISRSRVVGALASEVYGTGKAPYLDVFSRVAETGRPDAFEDYFDPVGKHLDVRVGCPGVGRVSIVFNDVSERKRAEEERDRLQVELAQAQKMESVGRLAGGVAHDFNNMLGVIVGHSELALMQVDPSEPIHADLEEIRKAAQRSADLTRQLLAFARRQTVAPRVLALNSTVADSLKMIGRLIGEDTELVWTPGMDVWPVRIDPVQVDQILANLCINARDSIDGVGTIAIETANVTIDEAYGAQHPGSVPGDYVMLVVSDDGCGIQDSVLAHVFEPFFTTKDVGQGTGLGLATVHGIVEQNAGFIRVETKLGHGTTFRIHLPRFTGEVREIKGARMVRLPLGRGETVLLVEDEVAILRMSTRVLEGVGYTVLAAGTPRAALHQAEAYPGDIHLLVTDVVMPGMNGRDLATRVKAARPRVKCLFMSGHPADVMANHGIIDEEVNFLPKPFSIEDLATKVREALENE